jgi:signal transduction histidine kinase
MLTAMNKLWVRISTAYMSALLLAFAIPIIIIGILDATHVIDIDARIEQIAAERRQSVHENLESKDGPFIPRDIIFILVLSGIVGIVSGIFISRRLTTPIAELSEATKQIGQKDFELKLDVKGPDEIKNLALAFNQMTANLAHAEQLRQNLLADVSHELRTPLTVMEGQLRAALDNVMALNEENLANLYSQTQHLIRLVKDLHELAQAEARKLPMEFYPTDIKILLKEVAEIFSPMAAEKEISLELDLYQGILLVNIDAYRIRQALHNLLGNALKYTPQGGLVILSSEPINSRVLIKVSDTGEGIHPDHLPNVFDRFYLEDPSRNKEIGGTGLGLAIVKSLVEAHGGSVGVISPGKGKGSTFSILLPVVEQA